MGYASFKEAIMSDIARFYSLMISTMDDEKLIVDANERLRDNYAELVMLCPHSESVEFRSGIRGVGASRRCKICGITDYASEGGVPGDEYTYGTPGHPSTTFWKDTRIELVGSEEFVKYGRSHDFRVVDGQVARGIA